MKRQTNTSDTSDPARTNVVALLLLALLAYGCATKIPDAEEKRIRTVAIVSLIPDEATFDKLGMLDREFSSIDLGGRITQTVETVALKRINEARPNWIVKKIGYDRGVLAAKVNSGQSVKNEFANLAVSNGVDALVVLGTYKAEAYGNGVGVTLRLNGRVATVHSVISLDLIGPNGDVIATAYGPIQEVKSVDRRLWGLGHYLSENRTPEITAKLSDEIIDHLAKSLNLKFDYLLVESWPSKRYRPYDD